MGVVLSAQRAVDFGLLVLDFAAFLVPPFGPVLVTSAVFGLQWSLCALGLQVLGELGLFVWPVLGLDRALTARAHGHAAPFFWRIPHSGGLRAFPALVVAVWRIWAFWWNRGPHVFMRWF